MTLKELMTLIKQHYEIKSVGLQNTWPIPINKFSSMLTKHMTKNIEDKPLVVEDDQGHRYEVDGYTITHGLLVLYTKPNEMDKNE